MTSLQHWTDDDFPVSERSNTPQMTTFLGGPESREQVVKRHAKFLRLSVDTPVMGRSTYETVLAPF